MCVHSFPDPNVHPRCDLGGSWDTPLWIGDADGRPRGTRGGESESAARHGTLLRWEGEEIEAYLYAPFSKMPLLLSF